MFFVILPYHLMVEGKIHFMGSNLAQAFLIGEVHLVDGLFKGGEMSCKNALVNQNVPWSARYKTLFFRSERSSR